MSNTRPHLMDFATTLAEKINKPFVFVTTKIPPHSTTAHVMIAGKPACHRSPHQYALVNPFDTSENYDLCNLCQAEIEKIPASTAAPVPSTADWTTKLYWLLDQVQQLQELRDKQSHAFTTLELAHNQAVGKLTARDEEMTALQAKLADLQKDHNDLLEEHDKLLKQPASSVDLPADLNAKLESFIPAAR